MKKSISLVLCLVMFFSVFSCLGITASAAEAKDLFTVESSLKNDELTYVVYVNKNVKMCVSIILAEYDTSVLRIDEENTGAYMTKDSYGDECEKVAGFYEGGKVKDYEDRYSIAYMNFNPDKDYSSGSSKKPFMVFTFKVVDKKRPGTKVTFYCDGFNSNEVPGNNISGIGEPEKIVTKKTATLGKVSLQSLTSEKDGIKISWKKVTGADFYRVYKVKNGEYEIINETSSGKVTSYLDTEVKKNKSYTYAVRAVNEASEKYPATRSSSLTTTYTVAPSKIKLSNGNGKINVSWSKVSGATAYRVYRRTVATNGAKGDWKYLSDKITGLKYTDTTVKAGTTYEYAIRVYSKGGKSELYAEKAIYCLATPDVSVERTVKGVEVSWDKVKGAKEYRIYRKVKGGSWETLKTVSSSTTAYTDKRASSGKYLYYTVKAIRGSYSSGNESKGLYYLKTPEVKVKNNSSGARVTWDKVDGATSYVIYRKAGSAKSWKKLVTTKSNAYTDKDVNSGSTYKYTVQTVNSSVKSKYGDSAYAKIRFLSAPKLGDIKSSKSGITINWAEVKGASGYVVYRKADSGKYKELVTVEGKATVKYLDKSAEKGTTYSYRVYAKYGSYKSSYKSELSVKDKY